MNRIKYFILMYIYCHRITLTQLYFAIFFAGLPIKKNKIVFCNYMGCGYGCNPKYIAEEIINQNLPVEIVWLTKKDFMDKDKFPSCIRLVDYSNIHKCLQELATAKIWIDNSRKFGYIKKGLFKKRGQIYINTWHGSLGIKRLDKDVDKYNNNVLWRKVAIKDSDMIDIMVSNSDFETDIYRNAMWFKNKIIEIGHPRNDIFFRNRNELRSEICKKLDISEDKKIALYVPSFRDNLRIDCFDLDYKKLKEALEKKTGEEWIIITKFHPRNLFKIKYLNDRQAEYKKDVSFYPDIQELLVISDIIISDYSSCMFDYLFTGRPCFIYAVDIEKYNNERGFYFKLDETPFPIAENNDELVNNIFNFSKEIYDRKCKEFLSARKVTENGNASKLLVEHIKGIINEI